MSSSNRLEGFHNNVFNRQVVLNRVVFNNSGPWGNQQVVNDAVRVIKGTVGDLQMTNDELRTADSILCMARHAERR